MLMKSKQTAEEVLAIEEAAEERKQNRNAGFGKMRERDEGGTTIPSLGGGRVRLNWHTNRNRQIIPTKKGVIFYTPSNVPEGKFGIQIGNERVLVDADDMRKALRWA